MVGLAVFPMRYYHAALGCSAILALSTLLFGPFSASLSAQNATSREVVQPLPTAEVQRLNRALMELARRPNSAAAMLEAGDASLEVDDFDAAIGFYGRARDIAPDDARVSLGLARVYLRTGRPVEAIPLMREAEAQGASPRAYLSDQALAFDLVGDQDTAQTAYRRTLELSPQDDETRRRLALSLAISGDAAGFRSTLAPLIEARDAGALRTRAFGLAILGEQESAEAIVNASMPPDLASRINPYLAYMPRLTAAQQAAAANLGIFPRAADIGREDPRIERFAREGAVGALLEPAGEPLGSQTANIADEVVQKTPQSAVPEVENVSDAFADLDTAELPEATISGDAVNLAAIDIPREVAPQPEAEAESESSAPEHPSRIWVQVATGRDVKALGFDWRRFVRRTDGLLDGFEPHVTPWGQANRLLAGPLDSNDDARDLINALAQKGLETFRYTSPEGKEIQMLD